MASDAIAQQELTLLARRSQLESLVSTMNLPVLQERFLCSDIFPKVTLELLREQDRKQSKRIGLGCAIAQNIATSLTEALTGDAESSRLVLLVNITVVSNGCATRTGRRASSPFRRGAKRAKGSAKLTVAYCLYCRETGIVAVSKQVSTYQERAPDDKRKSKAVLLELAERLCIAIRKEIFFVCCSKIPFWWQAAANILEENPHGKSNPSKDDGMCATSRTVSFSSVDTIDDSVE